MTAKVVTGSMRKMVNMSVINIITIILLKVVSTFTSRENVKELDMHITSLDILWFPYLNGSGKTRYSSRNHPQ